MTKACTFSTRLFLLFLVIGLCPASFAADQAGTTAGTQPGTRAIWAWADTSGSEHAIFISRRSGETWNDPQKISANDGVNVVPAVVSTTGEDLMVVWSSFSGGQAQLRYRQVVDGRLTEEKEYYTGLSSNMAPSLGIDKSGRIWLVWAGFNGISDEIYYSTWNGSSFAAGTAMTGNDIPDIQPVLGIDQTNGLPWVQWLQYSESGYVKYESTWDGRAWTAPVAVPESTENTADSQTAEAPAAAVVKKAGANGDQSEAATGAGLEIEIPEFVTNPESASVHIPGYAVQSLPVRSVTTFK